jgi:Transposase DDE domain
MSSSQQLYTAISSKLEQFHSQLHRRRLANWVWVIVGMILAKSVQLSAIANHIPASTAATARIAKVRRWLKNPHIDTQTLYQPIIQHVLEQWVNREVTIMLDGCFVYGDRLQMLRLSLSHCYRALPLAWKVVTTKGLVSLDVCEAMLEHVATLLKRTRRVTFLADRGFRDRDWARKCRSLNWDYIIRIANNTTITFADGRTVTAEQLGIKPGQRRYLPRVRLTLEAAWECNLAITWTRATAKCPAELCGVMTNLHADGWVLRHYLKRMHFEESFRDDKSGGFDLDASRLTDPKRLDGLLLALAIAVLWMYALGEKVLHDKQRRMIDPGYKRQLSVFQLGWRHLHRALSCSLPLAFSLTLHPFKPEPVRNSVS